MIFEAEAGDRVEVRDVIGIYESTHHVILYGHYTVHKVAGPYVWLVNPDCTSSKCSKDGGCGGWTMDRFRKIEQFQITGIKVMT
jgi:hypothetical protein